MLGYLTAEEPIRTADLLDDASFDSFVDRALKLSGRRGFAARRVPPHNSRRDFIQALEVLGAKSRTIGWQATAYAENDSASHQLPVPDVGEGIRQADTSGEALQVFGSGGDSFVETPVRRRSRDLHRTIVRAIAGTALGGGHASRSLRMTAVLPRIVDAFFCQGRTTLSRRSRQHSRFDGGHG